MDPHQQPESPQTLTFSPQNIFKAPKPNLKPIKQLSFVRFALNSHHPNPWPMLREVLTVQGWETSRAPQDLGNRGSREWIPNTYSFIESAMREIHREVQKYRWCLINPHAASWYAITSFFVPLGCGLFLISFLGGASNAGPSRILVWLAVWLVPLPYDAHTWT